MKFKSIAFILALTVASWAQTATQNQAPQDNGAPQTQTEHSCCHKMANAGSEKSCCHRQTGETANSTSCCSNEKSACCEGKDEKSCMKSANGETAATCEECCGKDHEKTCCSPNKSGDEKGMSCQKNKQCAEHCAAHAAAGAGN